MVTDHSIHSIHSLICSVQSLITRCAHRSAPCGDRSLRTVTDHLVQIVKCMRILRLVTTSSDHSPHRADRWAHAKIGYHTVLNGMCTEWLVATHRVTSHRTGQIGDRTKIKMKIKIDWSAPIQGHVHKSVGENKQKERKLAKHSDRYIEKHDRCPRRQDSGWCQDRQLPLHPGNQHTSTLLTYTICSDGNDHAASTVSEGLWQTGLNSMWIGQDWESQTLDIDTDSKIKLWAEVVRFCTFEKTATVTIIAGGERTLRSVTTHSRSLTAESAWWLHAKIGDHTGQIGERILRSVTAQDRLVTAQSRLVSAH